MITPPVTASSKSWRRASVGLGAGTRRVVTGTYCRSFLITYLVKPWLRRCELLTRTLGAFLAKQTSYEPILGVEFTDTTITSTVPGFGYGLARESVGGVGFEVGF